MNKPKIIPHPNFEHAKRLSPLELNNLRYDNRHTVITPELLEKMSERAKSQNSDRNGTT